MNQDQAPEEGSPCDIVSSRWFDVPSERVFAAFSDPRLLARWWGPNEFTNEIEEFDFRPGGTWRVVMCAPDGSRFENQSAFVEIEPGARIVFDHLGPMHPFRMTMTYVAEGTGTRLTWRMTHESAEAAERMRAFVPEANEQNFDRLLAVLADPARI